VNRRSPRRGRPPRYVSVEIIRALYSQGYSFRAISLATGIGYGTVRRAFHGLSPAGADNEADGTVSSAGPDPPSELAASA